MKKRDRLRLVDTTLRDGGQMPGLVLSKRKRLFLARILAACGVGQIEAGVPAMGAEEIEIIREIKENCPSTLISVWNRSRREDITASFACGPDLIHICLPVSELQIRRKLGLEPRAALDAFFACAELAMDRGYAVSAGLEDASRADRAFLRHVARELKEKGIDRVRLCDTVGVLLPGGAAELTRLCLDEGLEIGFHAHNDLGMAEANSLCAALAGASSVDVTLFGIGERAGNCDMRKLAHLAEGSGRLSPDVGERAAAEIERQAAPLLGVATVCGRRSGMGVGAGLDAGALQGRETGRWL
ncbi:MAG: hypothetical protein LBU06_09395 [Desulfovibrio sp.]|jgi:homocitrate synthase NifV|nr:hypothetical protein [Desulfovibrio sp.]